DGVTHHVYRTGDLVKRRANGELEFVGRIDDQVKLRGYRIELGEIESQLLAHDLVAAASVIVRQDTPGDKRLVGYIVPTDVGSMSTGTMPPSTEDLRAFLALTLPEYMVPAAFVTLEALPLTPNGKVDRKALPAPDPRERTRDETYTAPRTDLEFALTVIWSEILGVTPVGIHDDFFHLGGHSLLATRLVSRLRKVLGVEVPVRAVFTAPTPARLAATIEAAQVATQNPPITRAARDGSPLPLSFAQQRLWFLDQLEPGSAEYLVPFALRISGRLDVAALEAALSGIVVRHEVLRTRFVTDEDGRAGQFVDPPAPVAVTVHDLRHILDAQTRHESALDLLGTEGARPFDLASGRLLRADVVQVGDDEQYLLLALHHIVSDGWSEGVLWNELVEIYSAALEGRPAALPELPVQYADYAVWQRDRLSGAVLDEQLGYWREHLAGLEPLELPLDHARPVERGTAGDSVRFQVPAVVAEGLRGIASGGGASLFMVVLAAYQVVLSRFSGQSDVAVGTPI
ncbi:MAG TPA: condensation domain-containing protein, partial [Actinocrinis sp.]|nr:condensation domain-containing protein [Actinocrinis sp.]